MNFFALNGFSKSYNVKLMLNVFNVGHPFLYMGASQTMLLLCEVYKCQDSKNIAIKNPKEDATFK